jgi:transposase
MVLKSIISPFCSHESSSLHTLVCEMQRLKEQERRNVIVQHRIDHPSLSNYAIAKYFLEMGIGKSTVYAVLSSYANTGVTDRLPGSGRPAVKMPPSKVRRLLLSVQTSTAPSQSMLARKHHITQPYVCKLLHHNSLYSFKKQKAPAVTEKQVPVQKVRIDRLYRHILSIGGETQIIMDDESYFTFAGSNMVQNDHYYASSRGSAEINRIFRRQAKFQDKLMVWIALSPAGMSRPFFCPSHEAVNAVMYQSKCIQQRLTPFIQHHHPDGQYLFWPDLASCHYAGSTLNLFQHLGIHFVPKDMNPPNCPQLRPVEDFWGILKQFVYANGWCATSHEQLKRRIKFCLGKVDPDVVRRMMVGVKSRLRKARVNGVDALIH